MPPPCGYPIAVTARFARLFIMCWLIAADYSTASAAEWIRPSTDDAMWGLSNGIAFAIHPMGLGRKEGQAGAVHGAGGPRGLIRVGYPILPKGRHSHVNFIAIEPVVQGRRSFSELEKSETDGQSGKVIESLAPGKDIPDAAPHRGTITRETNGAERLDVRLRVEPFRNGARVLLTLSIRSDMPDELRIEASTCAGSAPIERCILTATMGNLMRARRLWLADGFVECRTLYPDHTGDMFAPHAVFLVGQLLHTHGGGIITAITTDEAKPATVFPFPGTRLWHYPGPPLTQYWRKEPGSFGNSLDAVVNARFTYWALHQPIPGGTAFENFELSEPFRPGQSVIFGLTRKTPAELGFSNRKAELHKGQYSIEKW